MSDSYNENQGGGGRRFSGQRDDNRNGFRGGRGPNNRDAGGFRIRLSDNEMRAAKVIQEAFNLRSTIAVLGFSIRTLAQMLEEGKLDEFVKEYRDQMPQRNNHEDQSGKRTSDRDHSSGGGKAIANPFARPEKPPVNAVNGSEHPDEIQPEQSNENDEANKDSSLGES